MIDSESEEEPEEEDFEPESEEEEEEEEVDEKEIISIDDDDDDFQTPTIPQKRSFSSTSPNKRKSPSSSNGGGSKSRNKASPSTTRRAPILKSQIKSTAAMNAQYDVTDLELVEEWIEVFCESEDRWVPVDVINRVVDDPQHFEWVHECHQRIPFRYVLAVEETPREVPLPDPPKATSSTPPANCSTPPGSSSSESSSSSSGVTVKTLAEEGVVLVEHNFSCIQVTDVTWKYARRWDDAIIQRLGCDSTEDLQWWDETLQIFSHLDTFPVSGFSKVKENSLPLSLDLVVFLLSLLFVI